MVDVCGFLAGPYSFTPFPVTASNVCGGTTLPHLQSCGFHGTDSTSPPLPIPGTLCDQAWHVTRSISFSVVQGQAHYSREANQSQPVSLWGFAWAPGCAHRSSFELWRRAGWSWGCHLANLRSLKTKPTHRAEDSKIQNWVLVGSSEH